jgi:hypothetical protein
MLQGKLDLSRRFTLLFDRSIPKLLAFSECDHLVAPSFDVGWLRCISATIPTDTVSRIRMSMAALPIR